MAKANRCSTCQKQSGAMHCIGCDAYFCAKDFRGHREILFNDMEGLVEKRNDLQVKINEITQKNDSNSSLIEEINKWEKLIIEQMKQVAETARQEAFQLLNSKRVKITDEFKSFSEELADLKESENFVEQDLANLNQKIREFHQNLTQLTQPVTIELNTKQSDGIQWNRLIYVQEKSTIAARQQPQKQVAEKPQTIPPPPQKQLNCSGRACPNCGKCRDWDYNPGTKRCKRHGSYTCRYDYDGGLYYGNDLYHDRYSICRCK